MTVTRYYAFRWTERDEAMGGVQASGADASDPDALREAWFDALRTALLLGWTEPKWWQWWRWNDEPRTYKPPPEIMPRG